MFTKLVSLPQLSICNSPPSGFEPNGLSEWILLKCKCIYLYLIGVTNYLKTQFVILTSFPHTSNYPPEGLISQLVVKPVGSSAANLEASLQKGGVDLHMPYKATRKIHSTL